MLLNLTPLLRRFRRRRNDHGAFAPLLGILLATGVVTGMATITVDVGNIMWERRQLQNGADAAAYGLAAICAGDPAACDPAVAGPELEPFVDRNAADDPASGGPGHQFDATRPGTTNGLCGNDTGSATMPACTSPTSYDRIADCPPVPDWLVPGIPYVEAYTRTSNTGTDTILPPIFAQTLAGGDRNISVPACARAAWGAPGSYRAEVPLTISECEWDSYMGSPGHYAVAPEGADPGYSNTDDRPDWPSGGEEIVIQLHSPSDTDGARDCAINGKDTAGGFGYVDPDSGCAAVVTNGDWANIDTGSSAPSGCPDKFAGLVGKTVAIPIFDCLVKSLTPPTGDAASQPDCSGAGSGGAKSWYHIKGWAMFYLSGYKIGGSQQAPSLLSGSVPCSGGDRCLSGWFVQGVLDDRGVIDITPPTDGFGAVVVKLAG